MSKQTAIRASLALFTCIALGSILAYASVLPCGYTDAIDGKYAGYGHHSLINSASEGFEWDSSTVPVKSPKYSGDGPYIVKASLLFVALYIPIYMGIIFLGWLILGGKERFVDIIRPSKKLVKSQV